MACTRHPTRDPGDVTGNGRRGCGAHAVLRDALATGLADDVELWVEWEQGSHNRKQITWSRGLREWAGLHRERTDEDIVDEDRHGEDVAAIEPEDWPLLRPRLSKLLDVVEIDGPDAARAWLTARGIRWSLPRSAPPADGPHKTL